MDHRYRLVPYQTCLALTGLCLLLSFLSGWFFLFFLLFGAFAVLGYYDQRQTGHSLMRNYPIWGRMRYVIEGLGPALRQYIVENNQEGKPYNRDFRSLVYQRAKDIEAKKAFGTELDVYSPSHVWIGHSMVPRPVAKDQPRVIIGGPDCTQPYSASLLNISAMSFGSLSANAIQALNSGASKGGFTTPPAKGASAAITAPPEETWSGRSAAAILAVAQQKGNSILTCLPSTPVKNRSRWWRSNSHKEPSPDMVASCRRQKSPRK